jgi:hypothetical protein
VGSNGAFYLHTTIMNEGNELVSILFFSPPSTPSHPSGVTNYGDILDLLQNDTKYEDIYGNE